MKETNNSQCQHSHSPQELLRLLQSQVHAHAHTHTHTNCQCHSGNNNNTNEENISYKKQYMREKYIFIPIILIKMFLSFYLYEKYFSYGLGKDLDIKYSQKSIFIFMIYLVILYGLAVFSSAAQTNINKYTILNINKKKELINLKQNFTICPFCHSAKFVRNSHCRLCNKCITFRDHHCPFVNNCVGFNNIQYFINFCFWGSYGIYFDMCSYFSFKYINLSIWVRIIFIIDFILNIVFLISLIGILLRSLFAIYNNRTYIETVRQIGIEVKCPFIDCFKEKNKLRVNNIFNTGFLNHLFYLVGPTLLHFILPLPKFKNYILDENCIIFEKTKSPDRLHLIKYKIKNNPNYIKDEIDKPSSPDEYIKLCHHYYDGKIIV